MPHEREFTIALADGVNARVSYSGRPIARYAVVLLARTANTWTEVRVYDNHLGTDHMHR